MPKNINITNVDSLNISDKFNINPPRKKTKLIHEQIFEQYGIDPEKVYTNAGLLRTLPPEWIPEILIANVNSCKTPKTYYNINLHDKSIALGFDTSEDCQRFYEEFNTNMNKTINSFIASKNESPKKYNRIIITEVTVDNLQLIIRY